MDDLILIAETQKEMQDVKKCLADRFKMKDMGELHYCLGVSVEQDDEHKCLVLHQKQYILNMLKRYGLTEANSVSTPADLSVKLVKDDGVSKEVDQLSQIKVQKSSISSALGEIAAAWLTVHKNVRMMWRALLKS